MIKRTLYFGNPTYLSVSQEQLVIRLPEVEKSDLPCSVKQSSKITIPMEDIGLVVLDNKQITITQGVLEKLLEYNSALLSCNNKRMPVGLLLPFSGSTTQSERFRVQLTCSEPLRKSLWQQTVSAKIYNQAISLSTVEKTNNSNLLIWSESVQSNDNKNLEARAAVYYWKSLFPSISHFIREREGLSPNHLLNYGYAILRAVIARGLVMSGLHPTIGIHHRNKYNSYCLADDIMEPYRPYVDQLVIEIMNSGVDYSHLTKEIKAKLLTIPVIEVLIKGERSPLMVAVRHTTSSLYKCYAGEARKIIYPVMRNE